MKNILFSCFLISMAVASNEDPYGFSLFTNAEIKSQQSNILSYRPADLVIKYWGNKKTNYDWWVMLLYNNDGWFYVKEDFPKRITNFVGTNFRIIKFSDYEKEVKK